jgi:lysophospholipase L1-like esterase
MSSPKRYVFIGDSITATGRLDGGSDSMEEGYVGFVGDILGSRGANVEAVNRGVSGDRVSHLRARWERDCLALEPSLVSIAIGINDTWYRYDGGVAISPPEFELDYRALLESAKAEDLEVVVVEPFLIPVTQEQESWRDDLDPKRGIVRSLALEYRARLVETDSLMNESAAEVGADLIAPDGVHPTRHGHALLANAWCAGHSPR